MKVLIIKTGYSETLDGNISETVSYGDVLRTTAILHIFKNDKVTWLTDYKAIPLLEGNEYIDRIIPINSINMFQVECEHFDVIVNLEKVPGLCALAEKVTAWKRFGFRFDFMNGKALAYERSDEALALAGNMDLKKVSKKSWVENLYDMMGATWKGEEYILGYKPDRKVKYDVGFNNNVGSKWPNKKWSKWDDLAARLNSDYSVSYQQSIDDIRKYIDWIASCRLIVSCDSLGAHIALALGKKLVCLFGPTLASELHSSPKLIKLVPESKNSCTPCLKPRCNKRKPCMDLISARQVEKAVRRLLASGK